MLARVRLSLYVGLVTEQCSCTQHAGCRPLEARQGRRAHPPALRVHEGPCAVRLQHPAGAATVCMAAHYSSETMHDQGLCLAMFASYASCRRVGPNTNMRLAASLQNVPRSTLEREGGERWVLSTGYLQVGAMCVCYLPMPAFALLADVSVPPSNPGEST
jgi:hypothetical protein